MRNGRGWGRAGAALAYLKAFPSSSSLGAEGFIQAAVAGEAAVSGRHYDNVAAALLGGFVTVASTQPLILQRVTVSSRVALAIAIPDIRLKTADMRQVLPDLVPIRDAVGNIGRAATLALALSRGEAGPVFPHPRGRPPAPVLPRGPSPHGGGAWLCSMPRFIWSN